MASVTLIGPDGAGKTTITQMLAASSVLPCRYLYMGVNIASSNTALFTSRLAERLKQRGQRREASRAPQSSAPAGAARRPRMTHALRKRVRAAARLANLSADAWYRQGISWYYQLRGLVVLYDRHFVFDFAPEIAAESGEAVERRLYRWWITHLLPRPDLVVFLDAPGEVLFARKGELSVAELERRRQGFLRQGERVRNFVRVDATRPLDVVYAEVVEHIVRFLGRPQDRTIRHTA
jgi:thymidylate kinase